MLTVNEIMVKMHQSAVSSCCDGECDGGHRTENGKHCKGICGYTEGKFLRKFKDAMTLASIPESQKKTYLIQAKKEFRGIMWCQEGTDMEPPKWYTPWLIGGSITAVVLGGMYFYKQRGQ